MFMKIGIFLPTLFFSLTNVFFFSAAHAELGGQVSKNAIRLQEQPSILTIAPHLKVYQTTLPSGTHIKEFVNKKGIVVAVSWQGPTLPDLKQLLGKYFQTLVNRPKLPSSLHQSVEIHTDELVVQSYGRMRSFFGKAFLPSLLPTTFNINHLN